MLFINNTYLINKFIVVNQELKDILELSDVPLVNSTVDDDQMTCIIDGLVERKDIDKLNLILTGISHEKSSLENSDAVLKERALLAFHRGEFTLVILYKIFTVINSFKVKLL